MTSLQVTVGCLCEDDTCEPSPCNGNPCENGGVCAPLAGGQSFGGRRRLQASSSGGDGDGAACPVADLDARVTAVNAACCGDPNCIGGAPSTCSDGCRAAVGPFWEDCGARLHVMGFDPALLEELQNTATQICAAEYRCTCTAAWTGPNCATPVPSPSPVPAPPQCAAVGMCPHTPGEGLIGASCYMWQSAPGYKGDYAECCEAECTYGLQTNEPYGPDGPLLCTGSTSQMENHRQSCEEAGWEFVNWDGLGPWRCCRH